MLTRRNFLTGACAAGAHGALLLTSSGCARSTRVGVTDAPPSAPAKPTPARIEPPSEIEAPAPDELTEAPPGTSEVIDNGLLPSPDCSPERVLRCVAGVRPYRNGGVRLELERVGSQLLVHNYGHGGAGVTLAPGCAAAVVAMLRDAETPTHSVAVLGAGVAGLTTAHALQRAGYETVIYTHRMPEDTTSWLAGGQWSPAGVGRGTPGFANICRRSLQWYSARIGDEFGVFERPNYIAGSRGGGFDRVPRGVLPPPEILDRLPFEGRERSGRVYQTLLVEPPRFLRRLADEVFSSSASVERRRFEDASEFEELPHRIVVNCLGLGARKVIGDQAMIPIRGQLVHLEPQDLPYLLSHRGYMFPRSDVVVLGGTSERGVESLTPSPAACERIRQRTEAFFG